MADIIVFTAINELDKAEELITEMLEKDLIISGTIFPEVKLFFKWDGKINIDDEIKIMIKAREENYAKIEEYIQNNHPYLFPELVKIPVTTGSEKFKTFLSKRAEESN